MLSINTNVSSLNAQRNLSTSQANLQTSLQRLSSGLRVNSAKDDAAGLYAAELMSADIRGTNQAARNASDGISLAQTAEGALAQVTSNLQRIREIAVQSANGTVQDRTGLSAEVDQLTQEISRIVQTTAFNGTNLFTSASSIVFQVGGDGASNNQIQVTTTDLTAVGGGSAPEAAAAQSITTQIALGPDAYNGMVNALFEISAFPGITYTSNLVTLVSASDDFTASDAASTAALAAWNAAKAVYNSGGGQTGGVTLAQVTAAAQAVADGYAPSNPTLNSYNSSLSATATIDVSSQNSASAALAELDADIAEITQVRSTYGAVQNRFEAVISNLQNYSENLTASRSRIVDADFASETANLTRGQVLQQAGTAVLAQANAIPQTVLALLR